MHAQGGYTEKVDIFSMGITFWQLLSLRSVPFEGLHRHDIPDLVVDGQRPFVDGSWDPSYTQVENTHTNSLAVCKRTRAKCDGDFMCKY